MAPTHNGPTALADRALGPDLARGLMLLFIALANSHYFLTGDSVFGGFPQDGGSLDRVTAWVISTVVDGRAFPLFGFLFGYGVARIVARRALPPRATRRLLWRRAGLLVAIGVADGLLLFSGDILAMYGVLLLVGAWAVRWSDRLLLVVATVFLVLTALPSDGALVVDTAQPGPDMLPADFPSQLGDRLPVVAVVGLLGPLGFACPFLLGLWAGRRRILERPARHRRLLVVTAVVGIAAAVLAAQPAALLVAGVGERPDAATLRTFGALHDTGGLLGGLGYAALIALAATRLSPAGRVTRALAATGQRSMSCYLAQSPVWFVVFTPYLLDLAGTLSAFATAVLATATWLATVLLADRGRAAGRRGPFERLVRRVTYGSS